MAPCTGPHDGRWEFFGSTRSLREPHGQTHTTRGDKIFDKDHWGPTEAERPFSSAGSMFHTEVTVGALAFQIILRLLCVHNPSLTVHPADTICSPGNV